MLLMKRLTIYSLLVIVTIALGAGTALSTSASQSEQKVLRTVLGSGLTVLHVQRDNLPMAHVTLLIKAGSVHEPADRAGLASMTASLLSEGTRTRSSRQISEEVEFLGASLGASAGHDFTTLSLAVLKKDIDKGFELLSDVLLNPAFKSKELKRKKQQVLGALRQKNEEPGYIASIKLNELIYGSHPYGRQVIGDAASVKRIGRRDVRKYYSRGYVPQNAILSVVGMVTPEELAELIDKHFSNWKPANAEMPTVNLPAPPTIKSGLVSVERDITQANIKLGHLGIERSHPDYYPLQVMNYILGGGGFSSRLMDRLRDQLGLTYGIYSRWAANKDTGAFYISIQTRNNAARQSLKEIRLIIEAIRQQGVTADELEGAKAYMTGSFPRRIDTMREMSSFLAAVEFYGLGLDYPKTYAAHINAVTLQDVKRVAGEHLGTEKLITVIVGKLDEIGELENE